MLALLAVVLSLAGSGIGGLCHLAPAGTIRHPAALSSRSASRRLEGASTEV